MSGNDEPLPAAGKERSTRDPEQWVHRPIEKYRKGKGALPFRPGPEFFGFADPVVKTKRTLLGYDRLYVFWQALHNIAGLAGDVAEIGSYRGGSAYFIADVLRAITGAEVPMRVFDTFEGHPGAAITEHDPFQEAGQFNKTSVDDVRAFLSPFTQLAIHQGDVALSLPHIPASRYRLVHIDTDLYQPTLTCLRYFGDRMVQGGVIVLDDYASGKCPGVPKAGSEYLDNRDDFQVWDMRTEQLMLVKR